ncbi:hypothetical protein A2U01_0084222, partial [Trifolium medium]|nr:hypothetical protein [Trifolium medium]
LPSPSTRYLQTTVAIFPLHFQFHPNTWEEDEKEVEEHHNDTHVGRRANAQQEDQKEAVEAMVKKEEQKTPQRSA